MDCTSTTTEFIENMAKMRIKYETIFAEQAAVLQTDTHKFDSAMARIQQSSLVAKGGERWEPSQDKVDEYLQECDSICRLFPRDFDDRVKILHAAYGALMCLVTCKIAQQPGEVQLAILKKHFEIDSFLRPRAPLIPAIPDEAPLCKSSATPRDITAEELQQFQNPINLFGKQFILAPGDDSCVYEVIGYCMKRDRDVEYDLLFDDCPDPIKVDAKEMMEMLADSLYLPSD